MDIFAAALAGCPRLGARTLNALFKIFETTEDIWECDIEESPAKDILRGRTKEEFLSYRNKTDLDDIERNLEYKKVSVVTIKEDAYPRILKDTSNPPPVIFYKGTLPETDKNIAIVGSRKCTPYGVRAAYEIGKELSEKGVSIVSGGARGIDTAAHEGCLQGKSPTFVIAAFGLDRVYPPENRKLFNRICEKGGAILSEYPLGTPPLGRQFPARNRIIAGLARGTVVVEAAEKSGSLITSDFAMEEGRDVFAIPGSIWSESSKGTHHLIRTGAILARNAEDILSEYGWDKELKQKKKKEIKLTAEEELVYKYCQTGTTVTEEEILEQSGLSLIRLKVTLLSLELKGVIAKVGNGIYQAIKS